MKVKTKAAYLDWKSEAERLRAENQSDPDAFTAKEFAEMSKASRTIAYKRIMDLIAEGRAVKTKKRDNGRLVTAYKMVKPA